MTFETASRIDYSRPDWRDRLPGIRARNLADQGREVEESAERVRCLLVEAAGTTWALTLGDVAQVSPWRQPARLPGGRSAVGGRSGSYFHIHSLAHLLGREADPAVGGHIVRLRTHGQSVALQVDRAVDVADVVMAESAATESLGRLHPAVTGLGSAAGYPSVAVVDAERLFRPAAQFSSEVE